MGRVAPYSMIGNILQLHLRRASTASCFFRTLSVRETRAASPPLRHEAFEAIEYDTWFLQAQRRGRARVKHHPTSNSSGIESAPRQSAAGLALLLPVAVPEPRVPMQYSAVSPVEVDVPIVWSCGRCRGTMRRWCGGSALTPSTSSASSAASTVKQT